MNGGHDLGGTHGLGPINAEPEGAEPVFHADWEKRVFALVRAAGALGMWTGDMSRHARERQHPADYLRHSYYENWFAGLLKLLVEKGLITERELAAGRAGCRRPWCAAHRSRCRRTRRLDSASGLVSAPSTAIPSATRASRAMSVAM